MIGTGIFFPGLAAARRYCAGAVPADVNNLVGWYKSDTQVYKDAGSTLAVDGDTVQQWNDQSGNGHNLSQGTAGRRPTFNTAIVNGYPALRFNGGAGQFHNMLASFSLSSPYSVFFVMMQHAWNATTDIMADGNSAVTLKQKGTTPDIKVSSSSADFGPADSFTLDLWGTYVLVVNGGSSSLQALGGTIVSGAISGSVGGGINPGDQSGGTGDYRFAEILVYSDNSSSSRVSRLAYIQGRYGIS